ncbi:MAG: hypothetical protein KGD60_02420 [Candidatus Thorarchaeota archaeon]|nr:hypothetical protein [Candidatus Thorarchaeota archaeon]
MRVESIKVPKRNIQKVLINRVIFHPMGRRLRRRNNPTISMKEASRRYTEGKATTAIESGPSPKV